MAKVSESLVSLGNPAECYKTEEKMGRGCVYVKGAMQILPILDRFSNVVQKHVKELWFCM